MNSLVGYDEELLARMASCGANRSSSAKIRFLSSRRSGTASTTSHAPATASASSAAGTILPGDRSGTPLSSAGSPHSTNRTAASR
jgi:hypothetical protein